MITIISGIAKSGKTYIAKRIVKERQIPYFSTDYLMVGLCHGNPSLGIDIAADDAVVAQALEPYLYAMIQSMVKNGIDYVIEGVHFNPDFAQKLLTEFSGKVNIIYLIYPTVNCTEKIAELNKYAKYMENCWYASFGPDQMIELVEYMIQVSKKMREDCKTSHLPYYEVTNIELESNEIMKMIDLGLH